MTELLRVVLATRNQDKIREIKHILGSLPLELLTLRDFPDLNPAREDGASFGENASKKALQVWEQTRLTTLADDSGLEVDVLDGRPGVFSARFAGEHASYEDNNRKLIGMIKHIPFERRTARFVCIAGLATLEGDLIIRRGEIEGYITDLPKGSGGFGYDPIFYVPHLNKTMAELGETVKNSISHRAKALKAIKQVIESMLAAGS